MSVDLPPARGSCPVPVWGKQVWVWRRDPWRIRVASVVLRQVLGFALERALGHRARDCTGADANGRIDQDHPGDRKACTSRRCRDGP